MPYQPYQSTWNNPYIPQLPTYQVRLLYPKTYDGIVQRIKEL